jgi:hypothetical protein
VRRVLEESVEVELLEMQWDEHWADVRFIDPAFGVDDLRARLMPAGAWCTTWPDEES